MNTNKTPLSMKRLTILAQRHLLEESKELPDERFGELLPTQQHLLKYLSFVWQHKDDELDWGLGVSLAAAEEEAPKRTYRRQVRTSKGGKRQFTCKTCGELGHIAKTCPRGGRPVIEKSPKPTKARRQSCGNCRKPGHTYKTCPDGDGRLRPYPRKELQPLEKDSNPLGAGDSSDQGTGDQEEAPKRLSYEEAGEEVKRLQREGLDSVRIAAQLKIPLKVVNNFWDFELAMNTARKDEAEEKGGYIGS